MLKQAHNELQRSDTLRHVTDAEAGQLNRQGADGVGVLRAQEEKAQTRGHSTCSDAMGLDLQCLHNLIASCVAKQATCNSNIKGEVNTRAKSTQKPCLLTFVSRLAIRGQFCNWSFDGRFQHPTQCFPAQLSPFPFSGPRRCSRLFCWEVASGFGWLCGRGRSIWGRGKSPTLSGACSVFGGLLLLPLLLLLLFLLRLLLPPAYCCMDDESAGERRSQWRP